MDNYMANPKNNQELTEIDLRKIMNACLKNFWKIAIITILCGSIFLFISYQFMTPMYKTSTSFYVNNKLALNGVNTNISSNDLVTSISLVNSYIAILDNRDVLNEVIEHGNLDLTYSQLSGMISTLVVKETGVFKVTVTSSDPLEAAAVAESIAHIVTTQISEIIEGSSVKVIDHPIIPKAPFAPNHIKNTITGMLLGLLASCGLVALLEIFDKTIKDEDELNRACQYPILTVVPDMNHSDKKGYYKKNYGYYAQNNAVKTINNSNLDMVCCNMDFATTEAYKLLRTKLLYALSDDQKCPIFLVSSSMSGEGKSISSINLAYSLAQLDKKVLLIDADMRRPTLATKLSISNYPGLSECLTGLMEIDELLHDFCDGGEHTMKVLSAGSIPPNPVELINSNKMATLLESLRKQFDYIIMDTPPVWEVSDALAASKFADGILLVVRHNYCNRTVLRDTIQQFEFIDAKIIGTIFNYYGENTGKNSTKYKSNYEYHSKPTAAGQSDTKQNEKGKK